MDHQRKRQSHSEFRENGTTCFFLVSSVCFPDSFTVQSILSSFCIIFLIVSRSDSRNYSERDGWCTDNTSPHAHFVRNQMSSSFVVVITLLGIDEHALSSFSSTPPATSLTTSTPLTGIRPFTIATPLGRESGRMADWTSNTLLHCKFFF